MKRAADRRARRTRVLLQQAHLSLILKKGYDAMSIQDICEAANVGRSTFYLHYRGKADLRRRSFDHLRELLKERQEAALQAENARDRTLGFTLALLEHAREHIELYRALARSRGKAIGLGMVRQILCDLVRTEVARWGGRGAGAPSELIVQYIVGAYMSVLTWWLDAGARAPAAQVASALRTMSCKGTLADP
jgi:AcrR family transcriptional regulator